MTTDSQTTPPTVVIVGAGVSGMAAGIFTGRVGFETILVNHGYPILKRNAHLENYPGFPAGVNSRLYLSMVKEQAERSGCVFRDEKVTRIETSSNGFNIHTEADTMQSDYVIAASWSDSNYLEDLDVTLEQRGSKQFIIGEPNGRTSIEGLYAAGRLADQYHQTIVNAGHGAQVAITLIHDSDVPFYHDWVAPEGYFTGRDREVPPGCEEINEEERLRRERNSIEVMRRHFDAPYPEQPIQHPSLIENQGD